MFTSTVPLARRRGFFVSLCVTAAAGCGSQADDAPEPVRGLAIAVAPLDLSGIGIACYDVEVRNGSGIVWSKGQRLVKANAGDDEAICSDRYGNTAGGDVTYIAPCDATSDSAPTAIAGVQNRVTLWVDGLYTSLPGADIGDWQDPCPGGCAIEADCVANSDTLVTFDLTILRAARQGFFDVAVDFGDIFCSAKLDTCYDSGEHIELLFGADGHRDWTAVLGLACSAGSDAAATRLEYGAITVTCGADVFVLDPRHDPGNASVTVGTKTLRYGVYRGAEALSCGAGAGSCNKVYWNLAIDLEDLASFGGTCSLSLTATATDDGDGFVNGLPAATGSVYPYIEVDATLTSGGAIGCQSDGVGDPDPPVRPVYHGDVDPLDPPEPVCSAFDGVDVFPVPGTWQDGATCRACDPAATYGGGVGTVANPYKICARGHLENVALNMGARFEQLVDLDLSDAPFVPLGVGSAQFTGDYDGKGLEIRNLYVDEPASTGGVGLFRSIGAGGVVHDVVLPAAVLVGNNFVGGIAGINAGTVRDVVVDGDFEGRASVGGIVGHNPGGTITRAHFIGGGRLYSAASGSIVRPLGGSLDSGAGGITGISYGGTISDCSADAEVIWDPLGPGHLQAWTFAGGILGYGAGATVARCRSSGSVLGKLQVGGIVGTFEGGASFTDCHSTSEVTGHNWVGGFAGLSRGTVSRCSAQGDVSATGFDVGGLSGAHVGGTISESWATGDVVGDDYVGGLVGLALAYSTTPIIRDSWSSGDVSATGAAGRSGGFIGAASEFGTITVQPQIERCFSLASSVTGPVATTAAFVGQLIGTSVISNDFYLDEPGAPDQLVAGITELDESEAQLQASYSGFAFPTTWRMTSAHPLSPYTPDLLTPVLAWQCGLDGIVCAP